MLQNCVEKVLKFWAMYYYYSAVKRFCESRNHLNRTCLTKGSMLKEQGRISRGGRGGHVPHTFDTFFDPPPIFPPAFSDIDLSEQTFSQSQGESSLGRVCHELQISRCSRGFMHSLLWSLAVWGKMHPRKKQRTITYFLFSNIHTVSMCFVAMTRFTRSNFHFMI